GFYVERIKGSHHILVHQNDERLTVIVPVHGNKDLKTGTLRSIIKQAGLSSDEFQALL
ncbi:MAG: type II toxin-antitoxin system HicA family toxin, partial [Trueperaceae bacterium]|nr:type II toxin-antitoxin system HicA family toxin [Trueperaceae bacterium]